MEETDIALKKIAKGAGIFLVGLIISKALAYAYRLIIARIGVEQYGLLSIALAVFNILIVVSLLGMGEGVIRFVSFYKGKTDQRRIKGVITSALKFTLPFSLVFAAFLFFASNWVAVTFFHNAELSILFKIFAFGIPLDILRSVFFSCIKAFQKIEYEVYAKSIAENVTKVILTLIVIYLGLGVVGAAMAYIASLFVSFILSFYFLEKKVFPVFKTKIVSVRSDKTLLAYSVPLLFTGFVYLILQWTDTLMLGHLKTISEVGVYNVALPTASLLYLFPSAVRVLFFPILSEVYAQNRMETFRSIYQTVTKWILIINSIIFVLLITFSKQIISFLFGKPYVADQFSLFGYMFTTSALALVILASGMISAEFLSPAKDVLLVLKKTKLIFLNTAVGSVFNVVFNFILIPQYGMIGAAVATGFAYLIIFALTGIEAYAITKINPFKKSCLNVLLSSGFVLLLILILRLYIVKNILWVIIIGLALMMVYLCMLLLTKSLEKEDMMIISSVLQKLNIHLDKVFRKFV